MVDSSIRSMVGAGMNVWGGRQASGPAVGGVEVGLGQWSLGGLGSVVVRWPVGQWSISGAESDLSR